MQSLAANPEHRWWAAVGATARAAVIAAFLLPVSWTTLTDGTPISGWTPVLLAALCILHALLLPPLVSSHALVAFGTGSALMLFLAVAPDIASPGLAGATDRFAPLLLPSSLVWFILLYEAAGRAKRPWPTVSLAVGVLGCVVAIVRLWDTLSVPVAGEWGWRGLLGVAVTGGTVAAWALGRYRATRLAWVTSLAEQAVADERSRIAREMHDVVAHSLAVVVAQAEAGRMSAGGRPEKAPEMFDTIARTGREALEQMRGLLGVLRDGTPDAGSVAGRSPEPPSPTLADLPALLDRVRRAGLTVRFTEQGQAEPLPPAVELTAYRVIQEALTNVVRHAGTGASAGVELDWSDGLLLSVTDDGRGWSGAHRPGAGRGIEGMRERLASIGGQLVEAGPTRQGWRVRARIRL